MYHEGAEQHDLLGLGALYVYPSTDLLTCQEVLHDVSETGKEQPWASRKAEAQLVALALWDRATPVAARMHACADTLWFQRREDGRLRLRSAHFCRARLCPVCQWRRSLKSYGQVAAVVAAMQADRAAQGLQPWRWLLVTLTVRNCQGKDLSHTLDLLQAGWGRMSRRKRWQRAIRGSYRAVEITYNRRSDTYHPHMHILCAVLPSYFSSRDYIPQADLVTLWRDACGLDYDPSVDMRRATGDAKSIAEVAKYATKAGDYLVPSDWDTTERAIWMLHSHCIKRRFAAWGGIMREVHHRLGLDDTEDGDLIHLTDPDAGESDAGAWSYAWDWYAGPRLYIRAPEKEGLYNG